MDPRRIEPRFQRTLNVEVSHGANVYTGVTRDVSLSGMCARLDAVFPFGTRVQVRFAVPGYSQPVEVPGEIRWSQPAPEGGRYFGIQFLGLRARDVWALNRYLHQGEAQGSRGAAGSTSGRGENSKGEP